ncbi:hypothetical protein AB9K34_12845 [Sedimentitalea sp. XS_ASV28]|uniref:hypothetical protein n=1 Tax=Sedimentitalea sp. XS_ASV28 TaxID=3241296 RepID=UPI00351913AC
MAKAEKREPKTTTDDKKNTSLRLSKKTLKALKIRAVQEETSVQKIIEQLIEAYLDAPRKKD